ncbi:MAG: septation protein A [Ahrensia sp.]|nr:septation protein A [Ahrensia sp.]
MKNGQDIKMASEAAQTEKVSPGLKLLLELGPVALFVLAYNFGDQLVPVLGLTGVLEKPIFLATAVLMVATPISIAISWMMTRTLPAMPMVTLVIVSIFGGLTIYLENDTFIKMKPTIVNTLFGLALFAGLAMGKSFLKTLMDAAFDLTDEGWRILTFRWALFFFFLAIVNEVVWRSFSEGFWVGFKFWGMTGLTMIFILSQTPLLQRHSLDDAE